MGREARLEVVLEGATMAVLRKGILSERAIAVSTRERGVIWFSFGIRCAFEKRSSFQLYACFTRTNFGLLWAEPGRVADFY